MKKTNEMVNVVVIDPETKTVYPTTVHRGDKGWDEMYKLIGCRSVQQAVNFDETTIMYCDEEGWCHDGKRYAFEFNGVVVPSKAVIIRDDGEIGYPEPFETTEMFKYINIVTNEIMWLGKKSYNEVYGKRERKQYTEEESIQYFMKQGADRKRAEQMVKIFGTIVTF